MRIDLILQGELTLRCIETRGPSGKSGFKEPFDLVVTCAGGFPLDTSFYQTVKGMCLALPALRPGGTLLTLSACDRVGDAEYEAIYDRFGPDWRGFLKHIASRSDTDKDQWGYQMQTRVLKCLGIT